MKHSDSRLKGPRLKPLAAGLAMVFAVGVFTLPSDTGAAVRKDGGRLAQLAKQPETAALVAELRSKRQALVQSRSSGDQARQDALRAELKTLRGKLNSATIASSKSTTQTTLGAGLRQARDRFSTAMEHMGAQRSALLARSNTRSAKRLALLKEKWEQTEQARPAAGAMPKATHLVTSCADDGSPGTLREVVAAAVTGDTVDLTQLTCSTITLADGGIWVDQDGLTIQGPGKDALTIDAANNGTVFDFGGYSGELAVSGVTLTNGEVLDWAGGAIWAYAGDVSLDDVAITNSRSVGDYYNVGGAAVIAYGGNITLTDSVISGNEGTNPYYGVYGAITSLGGNVELTRSQVTGNESYGDSAIGQVVSMGGTVTLTESTVSNNFVEAYGYALGGAVVASGGVTLVGSTVSGNEAVSIDDYSSGGGIFAAGPVSLSDSTVTGNSATYGGGVAATSAEVSITRSRIIDNPGAAVGAGVLAMESSVSIVDSTISGNDALMGAGISVRDGSLDLIGSTVSGNSSTYFLGGGIFAEYVDMTITNSTISGNSSYLAGGGIASGSGSLTLSNSTVTGNTALNAGGILLFDQPMTINSSIVFGNIESQSPSAGYGADIAGQSNAVINLSGSAANLVGDSGLALPGDTLSADPLLGALANHGGLTMTHALGAGSPAVDAGNNVLALASDQRGAGFDREVGGQADIGAYESQAVTQAPVVPLLVPTTSPWALGLMGALLGLFGWRQGLFSRSSRGKA